MRQTCATLPLITIGSSLRLDSYDEENNKIKEEMQSLMVAVLLRRTIDNNDREINRNIIFEQ